MRVAEHVRQGHTSPHLPYATEQTRKRAEALAKLRESDEGRAGLRLARLLAPCTFHWTCFPMCARWGEGLHSGQPVICVASAA